MIIEALFDIAQFEGGPVRGKYVYHYTKFEVAVSYILGGNHSLRIRRAKSMNDPLEHSSRHRLLGSGGHHLGDKQILKFAGAIDEAARNNVRIFSTSLDRPAIIKDHPNGPINLRAGRRGFDHPAMWAHYGEGHKGICLVFERELLNQSFLRAAGKLKVVSGAVKYDPRIQTSMAGARAIIDEDVRPDSEKDWASQQIKKLSEKLFLRKHDEWAYEEEFRWLILGAHDDDFLVKLDGSELVAVVVGSECLPSQHPQISGLIKDWNIPARVMMWTDGSSNHLWRLSCQDDPENIKEYWQRREQEILAK